MAPKAKITGKTFSGKVLHTPSNVANNAYGLSLAERFIGINSILIVFTTDGYFHTADQILFKKNILINELRRWIFIFRVLVSYQVIHYNFGSFLSPGIVPERGKNRFLKKIWNRMYAIPLYGIDVKLGAAFGKTIFVTFQGSDARNISFSKSNYLYHFSKDPEYIWSVNDDFWRERKIEIFDKTASKIFSVNPDLLNTLPPRATFIPYTSVFPSSFNLFLPKRIGNKLKVVHAPSNRVIKGTKYLLDAIDKLRQEGEPVVFTLVEGLTNSDALKIYEEADLVVDQLLAGWYGAFAVEAMSMGKPVVCYLRGEDLIHLPLEMRDAIPIINASPNDIYDVMKSVLRMSRGELKEIGIKSRRYVETWHNPFEIARKMIWIDSDEDGCKS